MKTPRTFEQIKTSGYIRQSEIKRHFFLSMPNARIAYQAAEKIDKAELGNDRIFPTMVRLTSVYKALGIQKKSA